MSDGVPRKRGREEESETAAPTDAAPSAAVPRDVRWQSTELGRLQKGLEGLQAFFGEKLEQLRKEHESEVGRLKEKIAHYEALLRKHNIRDDDH